MIRLKRELWIHTITVCTGIYLIYYLWWRLGTFNPAAMIFSIVFFAAEAHGIMNFLLFSFMTWRLKEEQPLPPSAPVKVDVFVPTYNESIEILEATLIGCKNMSYPHQTFVLDDGKRSEVRKLAESLGCAYITRPNNDHAKAGNINHALLQTDGEIIAIFDADTVPQPDFFDKTLGYFKDEKVSVVQLPQEFYNLDSVQHIASRFSWHEQQLFYRVIQPGKNNLGAPFWCGSPSLVRRTALEDVGGVATESVTEDLQTSLRLNAKGWKIKYHHEVLAYGIAPQTLTAFSVQRLRWAQGGMQIFFSKENPLILPGLSWKQRLSHFASMWTYFDSYQKLIFLIIPSWCLLSGQLPMSVSPITFLYYWLPYFVLGMIANVASGRGYFRYFAVERFNILKMFLFIRATLFAGLQKQLKFKVTPKTVEVSVKKQDMIRLNPLFVCFLFCALSIIYGSISFAFNLSDLDTLAAVFWVLLNTGLYGFTILSVLNRKYMRNDYRFPLELRGTIKMGNKHALPVQVTNLSMNGAGFVIPAEYNLPDQVTLKLNLNRPVTLNINVLHVSHLKQGNKMVGSEISSMSQSARHALVEYLYIHVPRVKEIEAGTVPNPIYSEALSFTGK